MGALGGLSVRGGMKGSVGSFKPADIRGLQVWYRSDRQSVQLTDTAANLLALWPDLGPLGHDVTAAGDARPVYTVNLQNGRPAVRSSNADDVMSTATMSITIGHVFLVFGGQAATGGAPSVAADQGVKRICTLFADNTTLHDDTSDIWEIANYEVDGAATTDLVDTDFHYVALSNSSAYSLSASELDLFDSGGLNENFDGDIAEFIIYDAQLNAKNLILVENYLSRRWGITPA